MAKVGVSVELVDFLYTHIHQIECHWAGCARKHDAIKGELMAILESDEWKEAKNQPTCPYTHAHTKHWCGYEGCRDS